MDHPGNGLGAIIGLEDKLKEGREFRKAQALYTQWLATRVDTDQQLFNPDKYSQELRRDIALAFNNRGHLRYLEVDFDGAVEDYDKALKFNPNLSCCYYNRGTILYRMGCFEKAFQDLKVATELSPEVEEFRVGLERCQKEL